MNRIEDAETGETVRVVNDDGDVVFDRDNSLNRDKISEESREKLRKAVEEGGYQDFQELVLEILTGQTVNEIKREGE